MEKIKEFLKVVNNSPHGYGYVNGDGYGYGNGDGNGDGNGNGYGDGDGYGNGYGYGNGDGNGDGNGNGYGDGYGYGNGNGNGNGNGKGDGLNSLNNQKIYLIDGVQTIIKSVKGNIAKGFIVNDDLSLTPCFIVKGENQFAHGGTIEKALSDLQIKLLENLSQEERIAKFKKHFNSIDKYKAIEYFEWHTVLTGSCDLGKKSFVSNNNIDLDKDIFTVSEFINLVENNYGSDVISQLKKEYNS